MYRFAFRGRYLVGHVVVLLLAALFIRLGFWQLSRLHQEHAREALIRSRIAAAPVELSSIVRPGSPNVDAQAWRRVSATGRYDPSHQMLIRFRESPEDNPGDYVVMPLVLSNGEAVLVVRGWAAAGTDPGTTQGPVATPSGAVTVTGVFLPSEPSNGAAPLTRRGVVVESSRISPDLVRRTVSYRLDPGYVQLQAQAPAVGPGEPEPLGPPDFSNAPPNFSYAVQWFTFTAIGLIGWPLLIRKRARERARKERLGPEQLERDQAASATAPASPTGAG